MIIYIGLNSLNIDFTYDAKINFNFLKSKIQFNLLTIINVIYLNHVIYNYIVYFKNIFFSLSYYISYNFYYKYSIININSLSTI